MAVKLLLDEREARQESRRGAAGKFASRRQRPGSSEERVLGFLGDVLIGDVRWQLSEVQRLLALHTLAAIGHWHADGLDHAQAETSRS